MTATRRPSLKTLTIALFVSLLAVVGCVENETTDQVDSTPAATSAVTR